MPTTIDEAVAALACPGAQLLAGGTDLMVEVNAGQRHLETVVALGRIPELRQWRVSAGEVRIGAGVTYTQLLQPELAGLVPALAQAARTVGSPQIRNAGTVGGNLATSSPAGDTLPVLAALDAVVEVAGPAGVRDVPFPAFITGPKRNALQPGEMVIAVRLRLLRGHQEYRKVGVRNAMVIAVASVALAVDVDNRMLRCALGSVGPTPLRAEQAEAWIAARIDWDGTAVADDRDFVTFAGLVADAARPIDDHRSTAVYRRHAVGVLAERMARAAFSGEGVGTGTGA